MKTTTLETLEAKSGHLHTVADWRVAGEKDPVELTDLDVAIIDHFAGAKAAAMARDARTKALAPPVCETKALPAPVATPAANVAHLPTVDDGDDFTTDAGLAAWADKNAMTAVPVLIWYGFVKTAREKRQQLEQRITQQDAEIQALKQRPADIHDAGIYREGATYSKGALTTRRGYWLCLVDSTTAVPGTSRDAWRLVVKEAK